MSEPDDLPQSIDYRRIDAENAAELAAERRRIAMSVGRRALFCLGFALLCGGLGNGLPNHFNAAPMMFVGGGLVALFVPLQRRWDSR